MKLRLKTAPSIEPVDLEIAKTFLRVSGGVDNALISALIIAARQLAEKETHRAFITQTWEMVLDNAPAEIEIPKPPLQATGLSIKVIDVDGIEADVEATKYDIDASENSYGRIKLKNGYVWPSHRGFSSFIIEFTAGYGILTTDVPAALTQIILEIVATFYEERQSGALTKEHKALLWPWKILRI